VKTVTFGHGTDRSKKTTTFSTASKPRNPQDRGARLYGNNCSGTFEDISRSMNTLSIGMLTRDLRHPVELQRPFIKWRSRIPTAHSLVRS
jgi:hypothetical protein